MIMFLHFCLSSMFFCCLSLCGNNAVMMPTSEIEAVADALNIEGGIPYLSLNSEQTWVNLCVVLDRPFHDGLDLEEITSNNSFPLKESSIISYNEIQVYYAFISVIDYYIRCANTLYSKANEEDVRIVVQIHRNSSGRCQLKILEKMMNKCFLDLRPIKLDDTGNEANTLFVYRYPKEGVVVEYRYGYNPDTLQNYMNQDIIVSLSLVSGFNSEWPSASLLIPKKIVPFNLEKMIVHQNDSYSVQNDLERALQDLVFSQKINVLETINSIYCSPNTEKTKQKAKQLAVEDFHFATILQANGIFNPKALPEFLWIEF